MKTFRVIKSTLTKALFILVMSLFYQTSFAGTEAYLINPGDILEISVWNEDALKREVTVLPDGSIGFPLAGTVSAGGKSVDDLRKELTKKLTEYIAEPVVNIAVKSAEGNAVYVTGQVKTPGKFLLMTEQMNVMQILSLAGGLTPYAASDDIIILRKTSKGTESIKFEYSELEEGNDLNKNHLLKSGDVIVVP